MGIRRFLAAGALACLVAAVEGSSAQCADLANYVPEFSVIKLESDRFWVCDHGKKIALFGPTGGKSGTDNTVGLIRHWPGHDIPDDQIVEPAVMGFVQNVGLKLHTYWIGNKTFDGIKPAVAVDDSPQAVKLHLKWDKPETKESGAIDIAFLYDPQLRKYVVAAEFDLSVNQRGGGEFCNFYVHGLGDARPDVSRYDRIVWRDADGKLKLHWLSFPYAQPGTGKPWAADGSFYEHQGGAVGPFFNFPPPPAVLPTDAAIAFVDDRFDTPVVVVEDAAPQPRFDICYTWFDVHIIWHELKKARGAEYAAQLPGPPYRYHAKLRAYWLDRRETADLLATAEQLPLDQAAFARYVPIKMNAVNDFEWRIDASKPPTKYIYLWMNPDGGVSWDAAAARSGKHAILFDGDKTPSIDMRSTGPELVVTPGKRVKIGAWVKTQNVAGEGFWLESSFFLSRTPADRGNRGPFCSRKLTGTNDWTWIEAPMPVTPSDALWLTRRIAFVLKGTGKVWLDDFVFAEETVEGISGGAQPK